MHVNKNCTVMTHALVNFSPWAGEAGVEGQMYGKLCSSGERETDGKDLPVYMYV